MKTEPIKEESLSRFLKTVRKTAVAFCQLIKKEAKNSVLVAENEIRLCGAVSESVRAFRFVRILPSYADGIPFLYRFAENFLGENEETVSEKNVKEALYKIEIINEPLFLLSHF